MSDSKRLIAARLGVLILLFMAQRAFSSGVLRLDESAAVKLAMSHSEEISIENQKIDKFKNIYKRVHAGTYPQLSSEINWNRYIEPPMTNSNGALIPVKDDWGFSAGIQLTQIIWAFGKVLNAIDIAEQSMKIQELSKDAVKTEICAGVKKLYYSFILASKTLEIMEGSYKNALGNRKALKDRYSAGRIPRASNVKMDADVAFRLPSVLSAQSALNSVKIKLADMLGQAEETEISASGGLREDFPVYEKDTFLKSVKSQNPVLEIYSKNVLLNERYVKLKKSDYYPTISGFLSYDYTGNGADAYPSDYMHDEIIGGVVMGLNLWDSGARKHALRETLNDGNIAKLQYERQLRSIEVRFATFLAEYESLKKSYRASLTAEGLAKESYDISLSAFRSGGVSQSALNDAELAYTSAKLGSLKALYDINMKIIEIDALRGEGRYL